VVLTLKQVVGDIGAVDVTGNVERSGEQGKETRHKHQRYNVQRLAATLHYVIPQTSTVVHLDNSSQQQHYNGRFTF